MWKYAHKSLKGLPYMTLRFIKWAFNNGWIDILMLIFWSSQTETALWITPGGNGIIAAWKQMSGDKIKEIQIILRLFLVITMYCQGSSSQMKSITQPLPMLDGCEGSLGTCYIQ